MKTLLILLISQTFYLATFCLEAPIVTTDLGTVIGKKEFFKSTPIYTFLSIPYAIPPTGNYRFKKPVPVAVWDQPLQANKFPPGCIQHFKHTFPWNDDLPGKSEDCLYLNVWTPSIDAFGPKKSVMFILHGGGFVVGSSRIEYYHGNVLSGLGDVVVVSANYRLGPQGFLYAGTENAPGNMGLYDILEALKWINKNIKYFGGDEKSVTLVGESSGAVAANMLMTSPLAQGLFHRAILLSGTATTLDGEYNDRDYAFSKKLAKEVGCANDTVSLKKYPDVVVQCLRDVDADELYQKLGKAVDDPSRPVYPRYGDEILPQDARRSFIEGNFANINVLIGVNQNEGSYSLTKSHSDLFGYYGEKDLQINKTLGEFLIREQLRGFPDPKAVAKYYLADLKEDDFYTIRDKVQDAVGDVAKLCPSVYLAEALAEKGNDVYFYFFQHRPVLTPWAPWMGVVQYDQVPFMLGYIHYHKQNYTAEEIALSKNLVILFTNFAKKGKPEPHPWPLYSKENHSYLSLRTESRSNGTGPHLEDCNFLRKYFGF